MKLASDRRRAERQSVQRPCKLQRAGGGLFDAARTVNVSVSGALVEVRSRRAPAVGERIGLAVAWNPAAVLPAEALSPARVVRSCPLDEHTHMVAVEFAGSGALSQAA